MSLYEQLSYGDIEKIQNYLSYYGPTDDGYEDDLTIVPTREFLKEWSVTKEHLFHLFGDKFILEKPIVLEGNLRMFTDVFDDLSAKMYNGYFPEFVVHYRDKLDRVFRNPDGWGMTELGHELSRFVSTSVLFSNTIDQDYDISLEDKKLILKRGEKVMRALRKLTKFLELSEEEFEEFRIFCSRVTQQSSCAKGTLCLSIHPLDFMTMSDNSHNWSSCMSWFDRGSYRAGTLEMMNAPHTLVAYIKDERTIGIPYSDDTWPSKRWRELYFIDNNLITGIMGYPYQDEKVDKIIRDWLKELSNFNGDEVNVTRGGRIETKENKAFYNKYGDALTSTMRIFGSTTYMYNDFERMAHKAYFRPQAQNNPYYFDYGGRLFCIGCGQPVEEFQDGSLFGSCCRYGLSCSCCGTYLNEDNVYYDNDGNPYCEDCFNRNFAYDDFYDQYISIDDAVTFNIVSDDLKVVATYTTEEYALRDCNVWESTNGELNMRLCDMSQQIFIIWARRHEWRKTKHYQDLRWELLHVAMDESQRSLLEQEIAEAKAELINLMQKQADASIATWRWGALDVTPSHEEDLLKEPRS